MANNLVNGKCYYVPIVKTFSELKPRMSGRHLETIKRTPFATLIEIEEVMQERGLLGTLMQRYDDRSRKFRISESLLSFRLGDVVITLNLRCDGDMVVFKKKKTQSTFEGKYQSKTYERNKDAIKKTLHEIVRKKREDENFVRLLMPYLLETMLFPNISCSMPMICPLGRYAWVEAMHRLLMENVSQMATWV
ncbi:hypothetical protein IHE45_13G057600 [Dioscorea alata]|uniref:Uncharacterized protein n=1 Tax=Dioscorea alata TaxID=55571 RepID=A0ACB7UY09_DIOAL|nr:hypothetical protein IHE45_13G057600 [Dioscorea alata]